MVTKQPTVVCPRFSPREVAMSEKRKKRLFSQAKLHRNAESSGSYLFSAQLTVVANVRNVALLKLETHDTDDRSDTCDA